MFNQDNDLMKNKSKICFLLTLCFLMFSNSMFSKMLNLESPNGKLRLAINITDRINYSIFHQNNSLVKNSALALELRGQTLGLKPVLIKEKRGSTNENLNPIVPLKFASIKNEYNSLELFFKENYSIEFRCFNNGVAYRFKTKLKKDVEVLNETLNVKFPDSYTIYTQQPGSFKTAYEEKYSIQNVSEWKESKNMSTLPVLIDTKNNYKILVSESDLSDYPCMFLKSDGENSLTATFPKCPLEFTPDGDRSVKFLKEADYIAATKGDRSYPWRYFLIASKDSEILENTLTYQLATPSKIVKTDWIKPGQVSWEWWNGSAPYGPDVDFETGCNQRTYQYYIDFAAKHGIQYIILDEGWAKTSLSPFEANDNINMAELIRYGKERNVDIILWLTWLCVEQNFDLFKAYGDWGIAGIKIDFMDRSDQWMVNFYERVAKAAADNHLIVDFHGSFKPAGLERTYPNVLSYEGVRGMEQMEGCYPQNSVLLPFLRNAVGAMDYTPGAMTSMQPELYCSNRPNSASIGTRAYQMALFVVFESGIQMLADSPTQYYKNQECTDFITQVPVTWDETKVLEAKVGEYVVVAKRKGEKWYIGAITNNTSRNLEFSLDFLKNKKYTITSFEDGINANYQAMDYKKQKRVVNNGDNISIKLARNGGWTAIIE